MNATDYLALKISLQKNEIAAYVEAHREEYEAWIRERRKGNEAVPASGSRACESAAE